MSTHTDDTPEHGVPRLIRAAGPTPTERNAADAERRRAALRRFLAAHDITPTDLAKQVGLPTPNAIYNHLNGHSASLGLETIERILRAFPDTGFEDLIGWPSRRPARPEGPGDSLVVALEARAGVWRRKPELPESRQVRLVVPEGLPHPGSDGFAVRVFAPGADAIYRAGTLLACAPLPAEPRTLPPGTRLILRRQRDGKTEISVRQLVYDDEHAWLWPRSLHPEHQAPIRIRLPLFGVHPMPKGEFLTVAGHIVAAWQPERDADPA
jgi:hypothetical protein